MLNRAFHCRVTVATHSWALKAAGNPTGSCTFVDGQDWSGAGGAASGHPVRAATEADCCNACIDHPDCAVAVFISGGGGEACWVKTAADMAGGSKHKKGVTSCKVTRGPPGAGAYSITGKVPGDLITDLEAAGLVGDPL